LREVYFCVRADHGRAAKFASLAVTATAPFARGSTRPVMASGVQMQMNVREAHHPSFKNHLSQRGEHATRASVIRI
jgi:hypothetical protein